MESTPATTMAETAATTPPVNGTAAVAVAVAVAVPADTPAAVAKNGAAAAAVAAEGGRDVDSPALPVASLPEGPGREAARAAPRAKVLHSADVVRGRSGHYHPYDEAKDEVLLLLPSGEAEAFMLTRPKTVGEHDPVADAVLAVAAIAGMPEAPKALFAEDEAFQALLARAQRKLDPVLARNLVQAFNDKMVAARAAGAWAQPGTDPLSPQLTAHLWKQAYDRVVDDPESLNRYRSFSKEVYGETCHPLVTEVLERVGAKRKQLFVDFGMGIGNVVFQAAAQTHCNVIGIELLDTPYNYAVKLLAELEGRVAAYRRTMGRVRLFHGDFLRLPQVAAIINSIDVVFVNNYAFEAETNTALVHLFISLKSNARVVSFKAFAAHKNRLTEHNADDPAAIFHVAKHTYLRTDGVSWAETQMDYFIHTVDRTRLRSLKEATSSSTGTANGAGSRKRKADGELR